MIVDDGSHIPQHLMVSLEHLWKAVRPGGVYVMEVRMRVCVRVRVRVLCFCACASVFGGLTAVPVHGAASKESGSCLPAPRATTPPCTSPPFLTNHPTPRPARHPGRTCTTTGATRATTTSASRRLLWCPCLSA